MKKDGSAQYQDCQGKLIRILSRLVMNREVTNDYLYYGTPTPWLQVKILKIL